MKNVVVFDVENVMFNVKNVEKWLKGSDERLEKMNDVEREKEFESKEEFKWWNEFDCTSVDNWSVAKTLISSNGWARAWIR